MARFGLRWHCLVVTIGLLLLFLTACQSSLPREAPTVTPYATMVVGPPILPSPTVQLTSTPMPTPSIKNNDVVVRRYGPTLDGVIPQRIEVKCQNGSTASIYLDTEIGPANAYILNVGRIKPGEWAYIKARDLCNDTDDEIVYGWVVYSDPEEQEVTFYIWD